ncbi:MAG TPA: TetR-like C-terminal domain-containing protein, partial [Anaerovoracaceae bacterium]|nr:TetR-like C-terminal domain-containing protein [Anaerovoracaceae bacterium]
LFLIFQFLNDNHEYFEQASKVQGKNSFGDFLYNYSYEFYKNIYLNKTNGKALTNEARVALEFNCIGGVHIVKEWLKNGRKESVADISKWTFQLIPELYRKFL